jgi:hypothetical protein
VDFFPLEIDVLLGGGRADKIKAIAQVEGQIEVADLTRRALEVFLLKKKQDNMESITSKSIPLLKDDSRTQEIEDDWITNFLTNVG